MFSFSFHISTNSLNLFKCFKWSSLRLLWRAIFNILFSLTLILHPRGKVHEFLVYVIPFLFFWLVSWFCGDKSIMDFKLGWNLSTYLITGFTSHSLFLTKPLWQDIIVMNFIHLGGQIGQKVQILDVFYGKQRVNRMVLPGNPPPFYLTLFAMQMTICVGLLT